MTSPSRVARSYEAAWTELQSLKRWRLLALLGYLPFAAAVIGLGKLIRPFEGFVMPLVFAWFGFVLVSGMRVVLFSCPACGELFFFKWTHRNDFARRCVHCGLQIGAHSS